MHCSNHIQIFVTYWRPHCKSVASESSLLKLPSHVARWLEEDLGLSRDQLQGAFDKVLFAELHLCGKELPRRWPVRLGAVEKLDQELV